MEPIALAKSTSTGFLLVTNDTAQDELAGPFKSYEELETAAKEIGVDFAISPKITPKSRQRLRDLEAGMLFRIDGYWYRLRDKEGKQGTLDVVGEKRQETMPWSTEVTEISVLSKR